MHKERSFEPGPPLSENRFGAALVEIPEGMLVMGGRVPGAEYSARIDLFDGKAWREYGQLAVPRAFHSVISVNGTLVILGGSNGLQRELSAEVLKPSLLLAHLGLRHRPATPEEHGRRALTLRFMVYVATLCVKENL